jgi:hypothetical protein
MDLKILKKSYKTYFGLIISRLYGCKTECLRTLPLYKTVKKGSIAYSFTRFNQRKIAKPLGLDLHNAGVKFNELFLNLNQKGKIDDNWIRANPNISRELTLKWDKPKLNISETSIPSVDLLVLPLEDLEHESFKKYSELDITPEDYTQLKQVYELKQKNKK